MIEGDNLNVGVAQMAISLLFLSNGNLNILKEMYIPMMQIDPRDVVMEAEEKIGNPGHYFTIPFEEMNNFTRCKYEDFIDNELGEDEASDLSF